MFLEIRRLGNKKLATVNCGVILRSGHAIGLVVNGVKISSVEMTDTKLEFKTAGVSKTNHMTDH